VADAVLAAILPDGAAELAELAARQAGRQSGRLGSAAGSTMVVAAVSSLGTPGLSSGGLTTGLTAFGGGSLLVGGAAAFAVPLAIGVTTGIVSYRVIRWSGKRFASERMTFAEANAMAT
ncbi:MAG TPA: hypothetical protein PLI18_08230, partial [Pirellulaceae bacterium]|nr:hypothetical protein [Pirellulaceae bacterium]